MVYSVSPSVSQLSLQQFHKNIPQTTDSIPFPSLCLILSPLLSFLFYSVDNSKEKKLLFSKAIKKKVYHLHLRAVLVHSSIVRYYNGITATDKKNLFRNRLEILRDNSFCLNLIRIIFRGAFLKKLIRFLYLILYYTKSSLTYSIL